LPYYYCVISEVYRKAGSTEAGLPEPWR